jgi:hypothetical protein
MDTIPRSNQKGTEKTIRRLPDQKIGTPVVYKRKYTPHSADEAKVSFLNLVLFSSSGLE